MLMLFAHNKIKDKKLTLLYISTAELLQAAARDISQWRIKPHSSLLVLIALKPGLADILIRTHFLVESSSLD